MRRDRRKRQTLIDREERKSAFKKLGVAALVFAVLFTGMVSKTVLDNMATKSTSIAYKPNPLSSVPHKRTITIEPVANHTPSRSSSPREKFKIELSEPIFKKETAKKPVQDKLIPVSKPSQAAEKLRQERFLRHVER